MARPILLAVDDDVSVLEAVVQDLRRQYGATYRIMRAASGQAALDTLAQVKTRQEPVALLVSDQRMPGMTGVEFLERAMEIYPEARRVLLTAYADTEVAIRAINTARIHYYLTKPWDPPEEKLYPVLSDLLEDWQAGYRPPFEGLRVIGHRWSLRDHKVRTFLSQNHVPYRWLDVAGNEEALKLLTDAGLDPNRLPVVLFADGSSLVDPEPEALAERVGLRVQATQEFYDLVVVGAGPAGLAAAVYGASEGLRTVVIEPEAPGGQAGSSSRIENYLGFPSGRDGGGPGAAGAHAGHALRRRVRDAAGDRAAHRRAIPVCATCGRARGFKPCGAAGSGRAIPQAGDSGRGPADGAGHLLRRRAGGGCVLQGRRGVCGGRRQLGRPGGAALCQVCLQGDDAGSRAMDFRPPCRNT